MLMCVSPITERTRCLCEFEFSFTYSTTEEKRLPFCRSMLRLFLTRRSVFKMIKRKDKGRTS